MANSYTAKLKKRLPAVGDVNWDDEWHDNEKIDDVVLAALLSADRVIEGGVVTAGDGLEVVYTAMSVRVAGLRHDIDGGSLVVSGGVAGVEAKNWIYVDETGVVQAAASPPGGGGFLPLALVDAGAAEVLRIADLRPMVEIGDLMALLAAKADLYSPEFTGEVSGISKTMVGLGEVDNTSDADKPVSTATQTALNAKANLASPTFTGTVGGITKTMVGLGGVDNTSDADKPVSTATQTALDLKAPLSSAALTGTPTAPTPAAGNNSTRIATTAFLQNAFAGSLSSSGYQVFPNGLIIQWAAVSTPATPGNPSWCAWPIVFPNAIWRVLSGVAGNGVAWNTDTTTTGCNFRASAASIGVYALAIGY